MRAWMTALAMLLGSGPALAAQKLDCLTAAVDQKISKEVFAAYRANENLGEALMSRLGDKVAACAAANGWSEQALESAVRTVFGQVLVRGLLIELKPFKVDPKALETSTDTFLAKLPRDKLRQFVDGELPDEEAGEIVRQLLGDEVVKLSQIDEKLGGLIGEYAAGRANETFFTAEFAAQ